MFLILIIQLHFLYPISIPLHLSRCWGFSKRAVAEIQFCIRLQMLLGSTCRFFIGTKLGLSVKLFLRMNIRFHFQGEVDNCCNLIKISPLSSYHAQWTKYLHDQFFILRKLKSLTICAWVMSCTLGMRHQTLWYLWAVNIRGCAWVTHWVWDSRLCDTLEQLP